MKQENNRGIIALLVVIIVILLALVVLLATGTISFKSNDNNNDRNNVENVTNQESKYDDNSDAKLFNYKNVPIENGFVEIKLTTDEKNKIEKELTEKLVPSGSMSSLFASHSFKELNTNYYADDCNKLYLTWWYLFYEDKGAQFSKYFVDNKISHDDFIYLTKLFFNDENIEYDNCQNTKMFHYDTDDESYIYRHPAGGGTAEIGIKIISKYQKNNVYYYLIHYYDSHESNLCSYDCSGIENDSLISKYSRFFKFKYGIREDNSKYIISLEYLN